MNSGAGLTTLAAPEPRSTISRPGQPPLRRRILVVDDEAAIREFLSTFLESHGFAVCTASDGISALALLQAEPIEVLLMDFRMPGLNGLELAIEVRRTDPHLPLALITGTPEAIHPTTLKKTGISRVFAKPFDLAALLTWLRTLPF